MAVILVIDDDRAIVEGFADVLEEANHTVLTTTIPQDGIEIAIRELPDVIFVDQIMPELSGIQVCQTLRQNERTADIPLAMISTRRISPEQIPHNLVIDEFLFSPIGVDEILHVAEWLGAKKQNRAFPPNTAPSSLL